MPRNGTGRLLRSINRYTVLELIRRHSPISRSKIARTCNISLPTVMRIVEELIAERLVRQNGTQDSPKGRPASLLEFNGKAFAVVGVDLGGTKLFGTVADLSGEVQHALYRTHEDNLSGAGTDYVEDLCHVIQQLLDAPRPAGQEIRGIGVGAPGVTLVPEGIVTWAPSLGWRDLPLQQILRDRFSIPVMVENDVNLAALGEWGFGAGQAVSNMVIISLGTGIGAGIIIDGSLYRGFNQAAGEIGYMLPSIDHLGVRYDGFGALEQLASGTGIAERAKALLLRSGSSLPADPVDAPYVFLRAEAGDDWAKQVVGETVDLLAMAIANLSVVLNPEIVVIGGGVATASATFLDRIGQQLADVIPFAPRLVLSKLGRKAAVMGAIMLVMKATDEHLVVKQLT
jgi:predicted NBD/HSP70 family sugar kinase